MTSGIIDQYVITGGDYETVVKSYHNIVGHPVLPPLWGLGW
jgi:alpha-glucosidase (family GH31 glycosyl hydrolase)